MCSALLFLFKARNRYKLKTKMMSEHKRMKNEIQIGDSETKKANSAQTYEKTKGNEKRNGKKRERRSTAESEFWDVSSIECDFEDTIGENSALEGLERGMHGSYSTYQGSFQSMEISINSLRNQEKSEVFGYSSPSSKLLAKSDGIQSESEEIKMIQKERKHKVKNDESKQKMGGFLEIDSVQSPFRPVVRAACPKIRYKKAHFSLRSNNTRNFLESSFDSDYEETENLVLDFTDSCKFGFKTPTNPKSETKKEIRAPEKPGQKGLFEDFGILDWAVNMNQKKTQSRIPDSEGLHGFGEDLAYSLNAFNRFFEESEDNNTEHEITNANPGSERFQRNTNWSGFDSLPKQLFETLDSSKVNAEEPVELVGIESSDLETSNSSQSKISIVNPNIVTYMVDKF